MGALYDLSGHWLYSVSYQPMQSWLCVHIFSVLRFLNSGSPSWVVPKYFRWRCSYPLLLRKWLTPCCVSGHESSPDMNPVWNLNSISTVIKAPSRMVRSMINGDGVDKSSLSVLYTSLCWSGFQSLSSVLVYAGQDSNHYPPGSVIMYYLHVTGDNINPRLSDCNRLCQSAQCEESQWLDTSFPDVCREFHERTPSDPESWWRTKRTQDREPLILYNHIGREDSSNEERDALEGPFEKLGLPVKVIKDFSRDDLLGFSGKIKQARHRACSAQGKLSTGRAQHRACSGLIVGLHGGSRTQRLHCRHR